MPAWHSLAGEWTPIEDGYRLDIEDDGVRLPLARYVAPGLNTIDCTAADTGCQDRRLDTVVVVRSSAIIASACRQRPAR